MNTNKELHSPLLCDRSIAASNAAVSGMDKYLVSLGGFVSIRVDSWFLVALSGFSLLLASPAVFAQTADDFFHGGAVNYLSNNIPAALAVVSNGLTLYPDDIKLKKLEELLKQQNQQQQQQQKDEQQKQDEQKDQQSKQDQKSEQKQDEEQKQADKKEQEKQQDQQQAKQSGEKQDEKDEDKQQQLTAHAMTPQEAKQLLDAQKGDEKVLQFIPEGQPKRAGRTLKDW